MGKIVGNKQNKHQNLQYIFTGEELGSHETGLGIHSFLVIYKLIYLITAFYFEIPS
jgi:hypothetical protein